MTRNLIVLGCAGLLALGLSFGTFAGTTTDTDSDGVPDTYDNCDVLANGPLLTAGICDQRDPDVDGYGTACDMDPSNNNVVDLPDVGQVLNALGTPGQTGEDLNCNGVVDLPDVGLVLNALGGTPGTSGLSCAGTIPCEAQ